MPRAQVPAQSGGDSGSTHSASSRPAAPPASRRHPSIGPAFPPCNHCGCRVIGHGIEYDGAVFCCASCAEKAGVAGAVDRV